MIELKESDKITEEELEFMECMSTPRCFLESMFHDFDALGNFSETEFGHLRPYQYFMVSNEPFHDFEVEGISEYEKFQQRKVVGDLYCFGSRKFGKSLCIEKLDLMSMMPHLPGIQIGFSSVSKEKIDGMLVDVSEGIMNHPFYSFYNPSSKMNPYVIKLDNYCNVLGLNMNILSSKAGECFYSRHLKRLYIEEASLETEEVFDKRAESESEVGAVYRVAGMTNFVEASPAGRQYYALSNVEKKKTLNLPMYVNSRAWTKSEKQKKIKLYSGEDSWGFRIYVGGEILKDSVHEIDMDRVRCHYNQRAMLQRKEIKKENAHLYKDILDFVSRPKNSERIWINADIGDGRGGSEIIIHSEVNGKLRYIYNITLYSLTEEEQFNIFKYLIDKLEAAFVGLDCGEGVGRGIFRSLEKIYGRERLFWYQGITDIPVAFTTNEDGTTKYKKGIPVTMDEKMASWGVKHLKTLLYNGDITMAQDYRLDSQLSQVASIISQDGSRRKYRCLMTNDHLFDAHKVFACCVWDKRDLEVDDSKEDWGLGSNGANSKEDIEIPDSGWGLGT